MLKPLNLSAEDRIGCRITYNTNRYEVYHADGWLMMAAYNKADLKEQLKQNQIADGRIDASAMRQYMKR